MTFDEIAAAQGWDDSSELWVIRQYIEVVGQMYALASFAKGVAAIENGED